MTVNEQTSLPVATPPEPDVESNKRKRRINFGLDRFSGLYVWAALIIIFSIWVPKLFLTSINARIVAGSVAITAIVALGLIIPVACGAFDLSIAGTVGLSVCVVMWMQSNGHSWVTGIFLCLIIGIVVGLLNSFVVVKLRVDSFIGTLGMSSILLAACYFVTGGTQIVTGISPTFTQIGQKLVFGLPMPVFYMIGIAIILWWMLEYTPVGRYLYAVGGNPQAALLAGVRVKRITTGAFVLSGLVAAFAGVVLAAELGSASPEVGISYLLPAFSAVFLGATQIRPGRVNVLGTLVAIFLLATGVKGLQLVGTPNYVDNLFNGLALIIAVALAARTTLRKA
jgi:ribose transport system permease protein